MGEDRRGRGAVFFKRVIGGVKRTLDAMAEQRRAMQERYMYAYNLLVGQGFAAEVARHVASLYARGEITQGMILPLARRLQRIWEEEKMKRLAEAYQERFRGRGPHRPWGSGWGGYPW